MRRPLPVLALLAALVGGAPSRAASQVTAGIVTHVDILYPPLSGVGIRPLDFGAIIPGAGAVTVLPRTPRGAEFRIKGTKWRKSVDISLTLPTQMTSSTGATIPLNFNGNYAALCEIDTTNTCVAASYLAWNPVTTPTFRDTPTRYQPGRKVYAYDDYSVYVGGAATPATATPAGSYSATIGIVIVIN